MYKATLAILHKVASATLHKVALATHKHALICCVCQCHGTFIVEPRIQTQPWSCYHYYSYTVFMVTWECARCGGVHVQVFQLIFKLRGSVQVHMLSFSFFPV